MSDNMKLWDQVSTSDPKYLKVNKFAMGGKIAIDPHYQIMMATKQFGPIGEGWDFKVSVLDCAPKDICLVQVWVRRKVGEEWGNPITQYGSGEWFPKTKKKPEGSFDEHAARKATTNALTKCLSYWGFNSDVFLGSWDNESDLNKAQEKAAAATLSETDAEKQISLMKEFNDLIEKVPEEVQAKARKFVEENSTLAGIEKAIAKLRASAKASKA